MNDMLGQSKSQLWRGFIFGCVTRLPYSSVGSNQQVWKVWDDYRLDEATMSGWWMKHPLVRAVPTSAGCGSSIVATSYVIPGKHTLVAVASWANETVTCDFEVDWEAIG